MLPYVAGILMCVLCVNLGFWQLRRAEYKIALQARFDAPSDVIAAREAADLREGHRVALRGQWLASQTVLLDNRVYRERVGFDVLTPLRLAGDAGFVLINRGWIAGSGDRSHLPTAPAPTGEVIVKGLAEAPVTRGFSLGESAEPHVWQRVDLARMATQIGKPVAPLMVLQENAANDGLVRDWPRPDFGVDMHRGYALQWFSFAALSAVLVLWFGWKNVRANFLHAHEVKKDVR
ncbi:MAG TPA: SURF1 family protein [Rhodocyclaceae bacterium]|nr:SURF1 family protein [Rhodocyclaceae bacterium]